MSLSPRLLESYSPDILQGECQNMLEKLQDSGLFHKARQVAELAGLPIDSLVINEVSSWVLNAHQLDHDVQPVQCKLNSHCPIPLVYSM